MQNIEDEALPVKRNDSSSLRKALGILGALTGPTASGHGASLSELSLVLGMNKSTLLRLLEPLRDVQLVEQNRDGRYRLGVMAVTLGGAYLSGLDLREQARPILERLAAKTGETVHLLVYGEGQVTYIEKIAGPSSIQMASRVGDRAPAYCTASGKTFLAYLPFSEFEAVVAAGMPARTPHTITTPTRLLDELEAIREAGYAVDDIENELDIRCVSAPVFDHNGHIVAAISASGPETRIHGTIVAAVARAVRNGADDLSLRLGAPQPLVPVHANIDPEQEATK
ncbi:IclR family transcriptional regulator [Arthrobacter sp. UYEF20]|uniref:IclR family transcriptional regulator n=1 Tax=Arthrobacter sp. UYEF20 TaxID=1756363 RepID=UPI00339AB3F4